MACQSVCRLRRRAEGTYHQLVVVQLGETFSTLGLARFADVLEQAADSVGVLQVVWRSVVGDTL